MKQKRWIKSVVETAQSPELAKTILPWQRGVARTALIVKRHSVPLATRRA